MRRDKRVVEMLVIENGDTHTEGRHESIDRGEPVLPLAQIRDDLELPGRLAKTDEQHALAAAIDDVEGASTPVIAGRRERGCVAVQAIGAYGAAGLLQQHLER